jgi:5-oxoprolinase (ATP-hydrolysing) subunit A
MIVMNLDAGEREDESAELWRLFDIVAIACGGHAGDRESMARVIDACAAQVIGAHPSYPDREGFGRRALEMPLEALAPEIDRQCSELAEVAARYGRRVEWVKPHGLLYHDASRSPAIANAVVRGARGALGDDVGLIGPANGGYGGKYLREGYADRAVRGDGALVPRDEPGAVITDPATAAAQAARLARDGGIDTICVHADTPGALTIARAVREALR